MRDRIEILVLLPFSIGCISESSIAVRGHFPNGGKNNEKSTPIRTKRDNHQEAEGYEDDEEILSEDNSKNSLTLLSVPKFQSLLKNFKNLSQLFLYKDDEMEEDDLSMDIGLPTDVKHVTHIGVDGSATSILSQGWDNLKSPNLLATRPSLDLQAKPARVHSDLRDCLLATHSTPSPSGKPAEVSPDLPAAAPVQLTASPLAMPSRVHSHVHSTSSPIAMPAQVHSPVRSMPSPLGMPAQVHKLNFKGA